MADATRTEKDPLGTREVPADALYGVQTVRAMENFPISGLKPLWPFVQRPGLDQEGGGDDAPRDRPTGREARRRDHHGRRRGAGAPARRSVRGRSVPGRRRHLAQHERERGAGQPRQRAAGRTARRVQARASERSRQHGAEHERHDPHQHPAGLPVGAGGARRRLRGAARRVRRQGHGVRRHREGRPHAPAGRDADPPRPGVHGLRRHHGSRPAPRPRGRRLPARPGHRRQRGRHRRHGGAAVSRS